MDDKAQDEALIHAATQGSPRAWEQLVRRYESRVYNYGLRLTGNSTEALDLMQEVFLGVYRNLHRFRGDARFSSWLFRIAHNKAVDMSRRRHLLSLQQDYDNVADECRRGPEAQAGADQLSQRVLGLLGVLPWEQRLLVELKVYQSLTFEEIAEMQGIPANTAKTRFYTAMRKLKAELEQDHEM